MRIRILVIFLTIHWHEFLLPLHRHFLFFEKSLPMMSIVRNTTLTLVPRSCKFLYTNSLSRNTSRNISFPLRNASAFLHNRIRSSTRCPAVQILREITHNFHSSSDCIQSKFHYFHVRESRDSSKIYRISSK